MMNIQDYVGGPSVIPMVRVSGRPEIELEI